MDMIEFVSGYFVNSNGEIFSNKTGEMKKLNGSVRNGYKVIGITINGKQQSYFVHRLVAEAFIPNPEYKPVVNHKDGNKLNNCVTNLEWVTYRENTQHAWAMGLIKSKSTKESAEEDEMEKYRKMAIEKLKPEIEEYSQFLHIWDCLNEKQKVEFYFFINLVSAAYKSGIPDEHIKNSLQFILQNIEEILKY